MAKTVEMASLPADTYHAIAERRIAQPPRTSKPKKPARQPADGQGVLF